MLPMRGSSRVCICTICAEKLTGSGSGVSVVLTAYARHLFRHEVVARMHLAPGVANISPLAPGRSVDGGNLPIDELMGVKAVDSIDLTERWLGTMSAIIISACIAGESAFAKAETERQ